MGKKQIGSVDVAIALERLQRVITELQQAPVRIEANANERALATGSDDRAVVYGHMVGGFRSTCRNAAAQLDLVVEALGGFPGGRL